MVSARLNGHEVPNVGNGRRVLAGKHDAAIMTRTSNCQIPSWLILTVRFRIWERFNTTRAMFPALMAIDVV